MAFLELLASQKLISRKIWVAEKCLNFHIVGSKTVFHTVLQSYCCTRFISVKICIHRKKVVRYNTRFDYPRSFLGQNWFDWVTHQKLCDLIQLCIWVVYCLCIWLCGKRNCTHSSMSNLETSRYCDVADGKEWHLFLKSSTNIFHICQGHLLTAASLIKYFSPTQIVYCSIRRN